MTKLRVECLTDPIWNQAGISIPQFHIAQIREHTSNNPRWIHFGGGNIFRAYIADLQQKLLEKGDAETGIIVAENYDPEIIERIYRPFDNLTLAVRMGSSGEMDKNVIASVTEALHCDTENQNDWNRIKEIFTAKSLQMCSFTITEKGYVLKEADLKSDPEKPRHLMAQVTALLLERYRAGGWPLAVVSMDNCSCNGKLLHDAVLHIAREWQSRGYVPDAFLQYLENPDRISFPWSMIDKITPRPSESIREMIEEDGIEDMDAICTQQGTYIAPFVNTEKAEYLVIEDSFPAGRPNLEQCGVIFTDRDTVQKVERMKVMTCLNPLHTALAIFGCLLGYQSIADEMADDDLLTLVNMIGYEEGMPAVTDPGIIKPEDFLSEVLTERFPNPNIPDTPQRIATDTSQKMPVRFGETLKAYWTNETLEIGSLLLIPLVIAAWIRYLMGIDDSGQPMALSSDPLLEELQGYVEGISLGNPDSLTGQLKDLLCRKDLFGVDLYEAGLGSKIEEMLREMIAGPDAVRKTLQRYLQEKEKQ